MVPLLLTLLLAVALYLVGSQVRSGLGGGRTAEGQAPRPRGGMTVGAGILPSILVVFAIAMVSRGLVIPAAAFLAAAALAIDWRRIGRKEAEPPAATGTEEADLARWAATSEPVATAAGQTRETGEARPPQPVGSGEPLGLADPGSMSRIDALAVLGLDISADRASVEAAYDRLKQRIETDFGGSRYLADRLERARQAALGETETN